MQVDTADQLQPLQSDHMMAIDVQGKGKGKGKRKGKEFKKYEQQLQTLRQQLESLQKQVQILLGTRDVVGPSGSQSSSSRSGPAQQNQFSGMCFRCGERGHRASECLKDLEEHLSSLHLWDVTPDEAEYLKETLEGERALKRGQDAQNP